MVNLIKDSQPMDNYKVEWIHLVALEYSYEEETIRYNATAEGLSVIGKVTWKQILFI